MIKSFRSRALERFWRAGDTRGIRTDQLKRLRARLDALDAALEVDHMDVPGYRLHRLTGVDKGRYAVRVTANWRLTFSWEDSGPYAVDVDYEDYH